MRRTEALFTRRRRALLSTWPRQLAAALEGHARWLAADRADGGSAPGEKEQDWLLLPGWLAAVLLRGRFDDDRRRDLLDDVLWSQYCLYLAVRVEDDLLDGQAGDRLLALAPAPLRSEAERALSRHVGADSCFWQILRRYHEETVRAIHEVDALQQQPGAMDVGALEAYGRVSSVLKAGSAAICAVAERLDLLAPIEVFADSMAVVDQILDDLADLQEDLERGRWNFAANLLLEPRVEPSGDGRVRVTAPRRSVVIGDAIGKLLACCHERVERARAVTAELPVPEATQYLDRMARRIVAARDEAHGRRVELFFAGHAGSISRDPPGG